MKLHGYSISEALISISILVCSSLNFFLICTPYLPIVFFAYAVVTTNSVVLFINESQLDQCAKAYLKDHVEIKPYDAFFDYLKQLPSTLELTEESVC